MKRLIKRVLRPFGLELLRRSTVDDMRTKMSTEAGLERDLSLLKSLKHLQISDVLESLPDSKSQLRQDLFVLAVLGFKSKGYFVEFGATDGVMLSNSHLLENKFGWTGILAEPSRSWHLDLKSNRSASIDFRCVWKTSDEKVKFIEASQNEFSTMSRFRNSDDHSEVRSDGDLYYVSTVSLNDLLIEHGAPSSIDYLSIDTEGSEWEILQAFDFTKFTFRVITCEHNYTTKRGKIHALLTKHGYRRVLEPLSGFDDWYIHESVDVDL